MKRQQKFAAVITMLLIMSNGFPASTVKADCFPEEINMTKGTVSSSDAADTAPMFSACIEMSPQGYVVMGTFTELSPDTSLVQPLYSLDGESWQKGSRHWNLYEMDMEDEAALAKLQTQACLNAGHEPLKSYLAGKIDRFYLKLCITRENGVTYETREAVIERGGIQPLPEDINPIAKFGRSIFVRQLCPYVTYGRYQLTISADATPEDIAALLPDTLPVEIQLQKGIDHITEGTVDCPVTWKPLTLPQLAAGESVTIPDAAEEIVVPGGTLLNTPKGIFQLNEPLRMDQFSLSDEVRLVLNVVAEDGNPTGVLQHSNDGLEMAFDLKPTGAAAIHAYTFSEGASQWTEIPDLSLLDAVNAQPSAASSGYALLLDNTSKLFQPYMAVQAAGEESAPFYVGLKIEGGVYDGRQLVLAWPDTYTVIPILPNVGGSGGNEGNAGANNKDDSTEGGQRPNLPQNTDGESGMLQNPGDKREEQPGKPEGQRPDLPKAPEDGQGQPLNDQSQAPEDGQGQQPNDQSQAPGDGQGQQPDDQSQAPEDGQGQPPDDQSRDPEDGQKERHPVQIQSPKDKPNRSDQFQNPKDIQHSAQFQNQENGPKPQAGTDTDAEEISPVSIPAIDAKIDVQALHRLDSDKEMSSHGLLLPALMALMAAIAFLCMIAAAVRKS